MAPPLIVQTGWPSTKLSPNGRPNRFAKAAAIRAAKNEGYIATAVALKPDWLLGPGPIKVTIHAFPPTRPQGGGRHPDDDNLIASAKAFLDGIANRLGVDDSRFAMQPVQWGEPVKRPRLLFEIEGGQ